MMNLDLEKAHARCARSKEKIYVPKYAKKRDRGIASIYFVKNAFLMQK